VQTLNSSFQALSCGHSGIDQTSAELLLCTVSHI